jgi:flagellar biosynthesis protein FliR
LSTWLLAALSGYALALCRSGAFVSVSPLPLLEAPLRVRAGLAVMLSLVIASSVVTPTVSLSLSLVPIVLGEVVVGLALGVSTRLVLSMADVFGSLAGVGVGIGFASTYDPARSESRDPLARIAQIAAHAVALSIGCHRVAIASLVESARSLPVGRTPSLLATGQPLLSLVANVFELGFKLALPVLVVSAGTQLALGLLSRTAPAFQIFNVGLAFMAAAAFATLVSGFDESRAQMAIRFGGLEDDLVRVTQALAEPP